MKRILVIDDSEVVRETLALILGRSFVVASKPFALAGLSLEEAAPTVDLLILGITPAFAAEASRLAGFARRAPCAVLFLVDSKSAARTIEDSERVGCLTKPFNPYELREKVNQLLARRPVLPEGVTTARDSGREKAERYLTFPYLTRSAACLVPRFIASRLPILISGEIGCGQDRVARALCASPQNVGSRLVLNGAAIGRNYLADKRVELLRGQGPRESERVVLIENLERMPQSAQSLLLDFLEGGEEEFCRWRVIATANADLLEKLYGGELLDGLYPKLATLTLKLPPLRERREDIALLADWFAHMYGAAFGRGDVVFSPAALERLKNYLWFGNLIEMEMVIARTLTIRSKPQMDAEDLVFDFMDPDSIGIAPADVEDRAAVAPSAPVLAMAEAPKAGTTAPSSENGRARSVDLNTVIHELAHELKNPMVTIKTFAQLLGDRYQDDHFRVRFQEVVGQDIDRMDELLEAMVEFADFPQPRLSAVSLEQKLRSALNDIGSECAKREARFHWKRDGYGRDIRADEAQLKYVLKNVLLAVLPEVKKGSEIEIDVETQGCLILSYARELARVRSIAPYLTVTKGADEGILPLRILLAKHMLERNGGRMTVDQSDSERDVLRMEFPIA